MEVEGAGKRKMGMCTQRYLWVHDMDHGRLQGRK